MRDSISINLSIHHITAEDYAKLDFPEEERDGTIWKTLNAGPHVRIVFFKEAK